MTDFELRPEEAFFIDSQYWDGHMIGDGLSRPVELETSKQISRYLDETLEASAPASDEAPLMTFKTGETCHPNSLMEGTVLLFDLERLAQVQGKPIAWSHDEQIGAMINGGLPRDPGFEDVSARAAHYDTLQYTWSAFWGVITSGRQGNMIQRVATGAVHRSEFGRVVCFGTAIPTPPTLFEPIGTVDHYIDAKGQECIERVGRVELCHYGQASGRGHKQRKPGMAMRRLGTLLVPSEAVS